MPQTLGQTIRGARLGYRYVERLDAYMRVTDGDGSFTVDLVPPGDLPSGRPPKVPHLCWWEGTAELVDEMLGFVLVTVMGHLVSARLKQPLTIVFNDDGSVRSLYVGGRRR